MKKLLGLIGLLLIFSCGNLFNKEQYEIIYAFVDTSAISQSDRQATVNVIKKRLGNYHRNVDVSLNTKGEIRVILNSGFDIEVVNMVVENQGKLDFWPCIPKDKMIALILDINDITENDTVSKSFSSMIQSMSSSGFPVFIEKDMPYLRKLFIDDKLQSLFRDDYRDIELLFGLPYDGYVDLYVVESNQTGRAPVNETHIIEARQDYDQIGRAAVSVAMNEYGAHRWYQMTNDAYQNGTSIAMTLNDEVYSAPSVSAGPIEGGRSQISGNFSLEQALDLSNVLSSQQMIPALKFVNITKIGNQ